MNKCAACQVRNGSIGIGGTMLCRQCEPEVTERIEQLRAEGKPVNVAHVARAIFKNNNHTTPYLLKAIPDELWTAAKRYCLDHQTDLRELILTAVEAKINK